jgi:hypothetical protein
VEFVIDAYHQLWHIEKKLLDVQVTGTRLLLIAHRAVTPVPGVFPLNESNSLTYGEHPHGHTVT